MFNKLENDWDNILTDEFDKDYFKKLELFLEKEYSENNIFPSKDNVFNALRKTSYSDTKVVIIGQDPYHGEGQAHGLSFSVKKSVALPPSLVNIFKEISDDLEIDNYKNGGELSKWAENGVLLLNAVLTVRENTPKSHQGIGWEIFTDNIIKLLNERQKPIVFMLWGNDAKKKSKLITNPNHLILTTVHPSPLSAYRGFFGCKHFSKANDFLNQNNMEAVDWQN